MIAYACPCPYAILLSLVVAVAVPDLASSWNAHVPARAVRRIVYGHGHAYGDETSVAVTMSCVTVEVTDLAGLTRPRVAPTRPGE